jgi:DNA-binding transcriptional ArsR family regulator
MMGELTEAALAESFRQTVSDEAFRFHDRRISHVLSEFSARDGRADFVLTPSRMNHAQLDWMSRIGRGVPTPGAASVMAALPRRSTVSEAELAIRVGLAKSSVHRILRRLVDEGLASRSRSGRFRLERWDGEDQVELWAYELKLSNWSHGFYQALQYRVFAHSVAIVLAEEFAHRIVPRLDRFRRFNVGVLALDAGTNRMRVLVRPRRASPGSQAHYLYAVSVFARRLIVPPGEMSRQSAGAVS